MPGVKWRRWARRDLEDDKTQILFTPLKAIETRRGMRWLRYRKKKKPLSKEKMNLRGSGVKI